MDLLNTIVSQLGVSQDQAEGGLGSILSFAQDKLSGGDFSQITDLIGGATGLMDKAPKAEGVGGLLGSVTSALGADNMLGNLGALASLAGQFKSLGLDADMIGKFAPIITSFLSDKGGSGVADLIGNLLKK